MPDVTPTVQLALLADYPQAITTIARWYYYQWGQTNPTSNLTGVEQDVAGYLQQTSAPLLVMAKTDKQLLGAAQLKIREMDIYPDREFWVGGVYVDEQARGKGIASLLVSDIIQRAKRAGIKKLHLQSEQLDGGIYTKLGFKPLETVIYNGHQVVVMEMTLG
ncbi:GNAT family N-acetyltransferase [Neptunicella sp. SCSIO 80796]|uniref:GNAT family N-acetyltransferase n=1 Tax=Neptunicella plasticusilytica TaxID=3117012 RepID=UPI003A4D8206